MEHILRILREVMYFNVLWFISKISISMCISIFNNYREAYKCLRNKLDKYKLVKVWEISVFRFIIIKFHFQI